jgi:salicylate hydroxylase
VHIQLLETNPEENWVVQDHDHAPTYFKSHVAILGDAAHATYPHAGNGAAQAIEDAAILTGVFSKLSSANDITAALQAFDEVRRPRSQKVIDITRHFGKMYSKDTDDINVEEMRSQMKEGGMYTNGVDMDAQVRDAVDAFEWARRN